MRFLKLIIPVLTLSVISGLVFFFYHVFFRSDYFRVKNLEIFGAGSFVNEKDLTSMAETQLLNNHILMVDTAEVKKNLEENFKGAKSIRLSRKLPSTVYVTISEREPLALIHRFEEEERYMVDEEGYVLGIVDEEKTNLPEIVYEGDIKVGFLIDSNLVPVYLELMEILKHETLKISSMSFNPDYVKLHLKDGIDVLIGNDKDKASAFRVVAEVLRQSQQEENEVKKIDLRYDKVIVSF